jgi:hypothetical protein
MVWRNASGSTYETSHRRGGHTGCRAFAPPALARHQTVKFTGDRPSSLENGIVSWS